MSESSLNPIWDLKSLKKSSALSGLSFKPSSSSSSPPPPFLWRITADLWRTSMDRSEENEEWSGKKEKCGVIPWGCKPLAKSDLLELRSKMKRKRFRVSLILYFLGLWDTNRQETHRDWQLLVQEPLQIQLRRASNLWVPFVKSPKPLIFP